MGTKQSNKTVDEDEEDFYFEDWETSSSRNKSNLVLNNYKFKSIRRLCRNKRYRFRHIFQSTISPT